MDNVSVIVCDIPSILPSKPRILVSVSYLQTCISQCRLSSVAAVHIISVLASEDHFQCHIVKCRDLDLTAGNSCNLNSELLHLAMLLSVMLRSALESTVLGRRVD